jgi:hypothetical protein
VSLKRDNYCLYNSRVYIIGCNYLIIMIIITLSKVTKHLDNTVEVAYCDLVLHYYSVYIISLSKTGSL